MALKQDLEAQVKAIFDDDWKTREGKVVPDPTDLGLGKDAVEFERATILYADLSGSTKLVDGYKWWFAAEIYKAYLHCAANIIRSEGGTITSYDGDRIMAVFIGGSQTTSAARCGLKINYAVLKIINPALKAKYGEKAYQVRQVVGIDTSEIRAARTGVRGDNDLVWVGRAANYAAKLTELDHPPRTWVTEQAYGRIDKAAKVGGDPEQNMWTKYTWTEHGNRTIYGSTWYWSV
jgi:class 3 adenylate cyclase